MSKSHKPLGMKSYGSIGHLPSSRLGPGDHKVTEGQARICTTKTRDLLDTVIVQEKLDGSNVSVALISGEIVPLGRAGYPAISSRFEQHKLFHGWAWENRSRFLDLLEEGERVCGEWLAQAHGTRYKIDDEFEPFHAFDIMKGHDRLCHDKFASRIRSMKDPFCQAWLLCEGPIEPEKALILDSNPWRVDAAEGVVYRVERGGIVDFLAKYVRPEKQDGIYLPEVSGKDAVWNWRPK